MATYEQWCCHWEELLHLWILVISSCFILTLIIGLKNSRITSLFVAASITFILIIGPVLRFQEESKSSIFIYKKTAAWVLQRMRSHMIFLVICLKTRILLAEKLQGCHWTSAFGTWHPGPKKLILHCLQHAQNPWSDAGRFEIDRPCAELIHQLLSPRVVEFIWML